jgi:hypothetical protein
MVCGAHLFVLSPDTQAGLESAVVAIGGGGGSGGEKWHQTFSA